MQRIFFDVLEINIAVAVLFLLLLPFAEKLRKRYGALWMKWVWLLLAVRLMIPYHFTLPFMEIRLFTVPEAAGEEELPDNGVSLSEEDAWSRDNTVEHIQDQESFVPASESKEHLEAAEHDAKEPESGSLKAAEIKETKETAVKAAKETAERGGASYSRIMVIVWIAGAGLWFLFLLCSYLIFVIRNKRSIRPVESAELRQKINELEKKYLKGAKLPVFENREGNSPVLTGVFHAKLVLPGNASQWNDQELEMILAHEFCHYRSGDLLWKLFMNLVCCVNWFNPVVYLLKRQLFYDMELVCDEKALHMREADEKEAYARVLIGLAKDSKTNDSFATGFRESKRHMKRRIGYLLEIGQRKKGILGIVFVAVFFFSISLMISCGYEQDKEDEGKQEAAEKEEQTADNRVPGSVDKAEDGNKETDGGEDGNWKLSFDYNHEYNEGIRVYGDDLFIAGEDGIYYVAGGEGQKQLLYENRYPYRRGMEIYGNSLYFCGSAVRGEEETATIYRMDLLTFETEDALSLFSRTFDSLYNISVYEDKLYVAEGYENRIGFELNKDGRIINQLDENSEDFLYREYNDYMTLEREKYDMEIGSAEYLKLCEEQSWQYRAVIDVAACKKLLNGRQIVSRYKDEASRGVYLEYEDGSYEHLCDVSGYPMLVTQTGLYYSPDIDGREIWYIGYEEKIPRQIYKSQGRDYKEISLVNYDADFVYLIQSFRMGTYEDESTARETYLIRIKREGGEAEKVFRFEPDDKSINSSLSLYRHCAVYGDHMYMEDHEPVRLDLSANGMDRENSGEPSEDARAMRETAEGFAKAFFENDEETLKSFLTEDFEGAPEGYAYPEDADRIEETYVGGFPEGNVPTGVSCWISYEFKGNRETEDTLTYLSIKMKKTESGFKVSWYGLEL